MSRKISLVLAVLMLFTVAVGAFGQPVQAQRDGWGATEHDGYPETIDSPDPNLTIIKTPVYGHRMGGSE